MPRTISLKPEALSKITVLGDEALAQKRRRKDLEAKLSAAAESCTTRKALADLLPEFAKYLPEDEAAACKTLPAVANIVADFTKAGWPKAKATATK